MANAPIIYPRVFDTDRPWVMQRAALGDGSNTFVAGQFVVASTTTGVTTIAKYAADGIALWGLTLDPSHASTDEAYAAPFGENHNCVDLRGTRFLMNLTDGSGTVGSGSTTFNTAAAVIGSLYSGFYLATPSGSLILGVDLSDTGTATKHIFRLEKFYDTSVDPVGDAVGDFNGRVIVSILGSAIQ